jgi:transcriptional regulator with XRE-family HTH domain
MKMINTARMKYAMARAGMCQRDLARAIGSSEVTISRYVNGERNPRLAILKNICVALGVSLEYLTDSGFTLSKNESVAKTSSLIIEYGKDWTEEDWNFILKTVLYARGE